MPKKCLHISGKNAYKMLTIRCPLLARQVAGGSAQELLDVLTLLEGAFPLFSRVGPLTRIGHILALAFRGEP